MEIPKGYVCIDGQYYAPSHPYVKSAQAKSASPFLNPVPVNKPKKRIRQSTKPLMNKLETEFYEQIKGIYQVVWPQAIRLRLGNGIWYKPDFLCLNHVGTDARVNCLVAYEVKGPHAFRGGFENLKVAAAQYPQIHFTLVWKEGTDWKSQHILP